MKKKGIKVYEEWILFENFYDWALLNGYEAWHTSYLWRFIEEDGFYPDNCTWVTREQDLELRISEIMRKQS